MDYPTILIPVYQPSEKLIQLVKALRELQPKLRIIVVNDGSDPETSPFFSKIRDCNIELLCHEKNLGKGQALKTGIGYWLANSAPEACGIVTADADGQHLAQDILHLAEVFVKNPIYLYLGVRQFDKTTPWRSRFGNKLTKFFLRLFTKTPLQDTQTGLRAIPRRLMHTLLKTKTSAYDFELEMLLTAKQNRVSIQQIPIHTIYLDNNRSSHFNPFIDSVKIYFVFLRFAAISLLSAMIDFFFFSLLYWFKKDILLAVFLGRILSSSFNFKLNYRLTFKSQNKQLSAVVKYASLASVLACSAYSLIRFIHSFGINVYTSKILAEIALFALSFAVQHLFIFNKSNALRNKVGTF
jgi:glycosyltransferase involved in cell wall biosynthesis